jgi:hypothetical protein
MTRQRERFRSGAVRDSQDGKPRPDLVSPFAMLRLGAWCQKGARHYGDRNWEKGMPISRCLASLERHLYKFKLGMDDEDHLAAIAWNAMAMLHNEEAIRHGILSAALDDLPRYLRRKQRR